MNKQIKRDSLNLRELKTVGTSGSLNVSAKVSGQVFPIADENFYQSSDITRFKSNNFLKIGGKEVF